MELVRLTAWSFRNLVADAVSFERGVNLVLGRNGEGKSSLLEAITMLGNLRSFRLGRVKPQVRHGEAAFRLEGEVRTTSGRCRLHQVVELGPPLRRSLSINGRVAPSSQYLQVLPVFALSRIDQELVSGPPEGRRAFLDRFTFLLEPAHFDELVSYRRVLRQRNAALANHSAAADGQLTAWDEQLAATAARVVRRRLRSVERLHRSCHEIYERLRGEQAPSIEIDYRGDHGGGQRDHGTDQRGRGGDHCSESNDDAPEKAEELLRQRYLECFTEHRERDLRLGFTGDGPHRHDLRLLAGGRPAREVLSSGQTKVLAASLRLAALSQVEESRSELLPVVVDDVDAELDGLALQRLIEVLGEQRQLFFSSAHDEMVACRLPSSTRFLMRQGTCIRSCKSETHRSGESGTHGSAEKTHGSAKSGEIV